MSDRRTFRRNLDRAEQALGQLEAIGELFGVATKKSAKGDLGDVIELEEVRPGVYAAPSLRRTEARNVAEGLQRGYALVHRLRQSLDQLDELEKRSRQLAKEKPWQKPR